MLSELRKWDEGGEVVSTNQIAQATDYMGRTLEFDIASIHEIWHFELARLADSMKSKDRATRCNKT